MVESVECVVVGGGVIGLAIARALAQAGREVMLLEKEKLLGSETSSRNSEVIHAGLYYTAGSLKAKLCLAGKEKLYAYCAERGVNHRRIGKLVVAVTEDESKQLAGIMAKAKINGVADLELIDGDNARRMEPNLSCVAAFLSPSTGIVDSHGLMQSYEGDAENAGALIVKRAEVIGGAVRPGGGFTLEVGGDEKMSLACDVLINSAGLHAPALAGKIAGLPPGAVPPYYFCRGVYFTLSGKAPFERLIYPMPDYVSLGVHYTCDLGGGAKFGPDIEWIDSIDYTVDPRRGDKFYAAIRKYFPGLKDGSLEPGYAGIRPKITGPGAAAADFTIQGPETHGVPGLVNLFNMESPGLTSSLAIADYVAGLLDPAAAIKAPPVPPRPESRP